LKLLKNYDFEALNATYSNQGDTTMITKSKIALAAMLLAGTASVAAAQGFAPNAHEKFQSAAARLRSDRAFMPDANQVLEENNWFATAVSDHASSPYAGGGGK
jgi:hypothetical protein